MENIFIKLLGMSLNAGWLILAALLFRLIFKNAPKYIRCILWGLAGLRLMCPFSIKSKLSLVPKTQSTSSEEYLAPLLPSQSFSATTSETFMPQITTHPEEAVDSPSLLSSFSAFLPYLWLIGLFVMLCYALISSVRLHKKVTPSLSTPDGVRICDSIDTPFILGIIKPTIYIPSSLSDAQKDKVLDHERAHIRRFDHIWKPLGFVLLSVYWFNPLMWLGYVLLCRDIELACDEKVIRKMGLEEKKEYSNVLLSCSIPHSAISACPLAFGEVGVKGRIKSVLNYKKPGFWLILAALAVCIFLAVCFLTDPLEKTLSESEEIRLHDIILEHGGEEQTADRYPCEDHMILHTEHRSGKTKVYALVWYGVYSKLEDGHIEEESGWHVPAVITFDEESYTYEESEDGTNYVPSIRRLFPWYLQRKAINIHKYSNEQGARCMKEAESYFALSGADFSNDVPVILYGDSEKAILHCRFGIMVYRTDGSISIISVPTIDPRHFYRANVSADGKRLYVTDMLKSIYEVGINPLVFDTETLKPCDAPENDEINLCKAVPDELPFPIVFECMEFGPMCDSHDGFTWYSAVDDEGKIRLIRYTDATGECTISDVIPEHYGEAAMPVSMESDAGVEEFIKALLKKHPDSIYNGDEINPDKCRNVTPDEVAQATDIALFKFAGSCSSFVFADGEIYDIPSFGGFGLHNAVPCDFDGNGVIDLLIASSWGSGIHRSEISVFNRSRKELTTFYTNLEESMHNPAMCADLIVRKSGAEYQILTAQSELHDSIFNVSFTPIEVIGAVEMTGGKVTATIFEK